MPIPTYTLGYPPDGSSLGQTKSTIRNNLDGTFKTLAVDHVNNNGKPGNNPAGYHTIIHMVPQGSSPAAIEGYGQLFSQSIDSVVEDTVMFWETGTGLIQQMTVNLDPVADTDGYTFIPGGIILQWGQSTSSSATQAITFPIKFPNSCFNVQVTATGSSTVSNAYNVKYSSGFSRSGFTFLYAGSSINGFFWFAIGN